MMRSIDLFRSSSSAPSATKEKQNIVAEAKGILAVVGDSQIQSTIEQSLESIGLELIFVTSGEAADEFLNKRSAVLVISEIDLPIMNGLSLARRIKEDATLGDVPVLLISNSSDGPDKVMGMETGADDYITLPINPSDLRSRVMALLARTKIEPENEDNSDLNEFEEVDDREETVIGAGAQSIPVDELGLGDAEEAPTETPDSQEETVTEQSESIIMEELNPVDDLSSAETDTSFPEDKPALEEAQPGQPRSAIVEEANPFAVQESSQIQDNAAPPIDEKPESPSGEEAAAVSTLEVDEHSAPALPEPLPLDDSQSNLSPPVIEPETEAPVPNAVNDPGTESMINDIFGSSTDSKVAQENTRRQAATQMETPAPPIPPVETDSTVQSANIQPPPVSPLPAQPVAPAETVTPPNPADIPPQAQPQQTAQPLPQQPVTHQQAIETGTLIPADQQPVQAPPVIPPPVPIQTQPQVAPPIPSEADALQVDVNEAALAGYDYEARVDDKEVYNTTISDLKEFETGVTEGGAIGFDKLISDARNIVSSVQQSNYLHIKAIGRREAHDFPVHSINVAIFSVKLATGLNYENKLLTELAVSALLHDVGMLLLPEGIRHAKSKLSDEEFATLRTHPSIGSEYIAKALQSNPELTQFNFLPSVVLQEHERYDGTGYPNGTAKDEIHDYAKIISIIDMYEAVSHPSTYRDEYLAYEALQKVVALKDTYFDVKFLRALVREISVFPLESLVRLNNGEIGQVIGLDGSHPMRPKLKILYNEDGDKYPEEKVIELAKSPFLYIETPITEEEIVKKSDN
ncbi:MAG: response regulator [Candidatus Marinimicrobia bacterium]|nr:response regulator [Candidatus Neomarinimicrobiota bacterium]